MRRGRRMLVGPGCPARPRDRAIRRCGVGGSCVRSLVEISDAEGVYGHGPRAVSTLRRPDGGQRVRAVLRGVLLLVLRRVRLHANPGGIPGRAAAVGGPGRFARWASEGSELTPGAAPARIVSE